MTAYRGTRVIAPLILNLGTQTWVIGELDVTAALPLGKSH